MNYVLDTNILLGYLREEPSIVQKLEEMNLFSDTNFLFISIVSSAELMSLAKQRNWSDSKFQKMVNFLDDFLTVPIDTKEILVIYSDIDAYSQGKLKNKPLPIETSARNMGKNDIWIAATAKITNSTLLTMDKDFAHLNTIFFDVKLLERN